MNLSQGRAVVQQVEKEVSGLDKDSGQEYTFVEYRNHFQVFLLAGILLLLLEMLISEKEIRSYAGYTRTETRPMKGNFLIILMLLSPGVFAQQENKYIQEGNNNTMTGKQYDAAEQYYRQALENNPPSGRLPTTWAMRCITSRNWTRVLPAMMPSLPPPATHPSAPKPTTTWVMLTWRRRIMRKALKRTNRR